MRTDCGFGGRGVLVNAGYAGGKRDGNVDHRIF